jgi:uncharacterized protein YbjT (DUF2867 family)
LEALGADVVVADLFDIDGLRAAMNGTRRAYFTLPFHPHALQVGAAFAIAASEARLEAIVGMTQWLASPVHPAAQTRQSWLTDRILAMVPGAAHVVVDPGYFADNYLTPMVLRTAAHLGIYPFPFGDSKNAPPSNEDIARVAVACLLDPEAHAGRTYRPAGPELIGGSDIAAALARVFERPVRAVDLPWWLFAKALRVAGFDRDFQMNLRHYVADHKAGAFAFAAPSGDVERLTGRAAESFETIARRYGADPSLRPTLANRLRAIAEFAVLPLIPAYDLERYARGMQFVAPRHPELAMENGHWIAERLARATPEPARASEAGAA